MSTAEIAAMILALEAPHPLRIGIDGFCAAGKTTLANAVAEKLEAKERRVIRASADNFQNPPEVRWQLGPRSPEGFFRHAPRCRGRARVLFLIGRLYSGGQCGIATFETPS